MLLSYFMRVSVWKEWSNTSGPWFYWLEARLPMFAKYIWSFHKAVAGLAEFQVKAMRLLVAA